MNGLNHIKYLYDASGTKLAKLTLEEGVPQHTTDYVGSFVYEDCQLQYILTGEGRIVFFPDGNHEYQYFLKDHLGNTRVTFNEGGIIQEDSYYPFGLTMAGLSQQSGQDLPNKYLYNGKELQDDFGLDWYDYGARFYDAQIGRWHVVDPLADFFYFKSPYGYVSNNPLSRIDPTGMADKDIWGRDRFDENGIYIPPHERGNTNKPDTPSFSGNFLEDFASVLGEAFYSLFFDDEELPDGESAPKVKDEVRAVEDGPVAIIISGNGSGSFAVGGIDFEQGVVIVLQGDDQGVYALTDLGGVLSSTQLASASTTGKVTAVFFTGDPGDFKIGEHLSGTRTEANMGIGAPVPVTATVNFGGFVGAEKNKDKTRTFGLYIGAGGSASYKALGAVSLQVNIGATAVY